MPVQFSTEISEENILQWALCIFKCRQDVMDIVEKSGKFSKKFQGFTGWYYMWYQIIHFLMKGWLIMMTLIDIDPVRYRLLSRKLPSTALSLCSFRHLWSFREETEQLKNSGGIRLGAQIQELCLLPRSGWLSDSTGAIWTWLLMEGAVGHWLGMYMRTTGNW